MKAINTPSLLDFIPELNEHILPIYTEHERSFDFYRIHGRLHICRALLFAEAMGQFYLSRGQKPDMYAVRTATAFHDSGRQDSGEDRWEHDSAALCKNYLLNTSPRRSVYQLDIRLADFAANLIPRKGPPSLESQILHDADVLEYMRLFSRDEWQTRFQRERLIFLSPHDPYIPAEFDAESTRTSLIWEVWGLIEETRKQQTQFDGSKNYFQEFLQDFVKHKSRYPLLVGWLTLSLQE